jgi:putative solute:sodium symporter small subunit
MTREQQDSYWRQNLVYIAAVLTAWTSVSLGAGVLFADRLNAFRIAGFPLGFWFANQGSVLAFVVLTFVYVGLMNRLDRKFGVYEA